MIIESIFNGQIYPCETALPKSREFREAEAAAADIMTYFEQKLGKEDYEKMEMFKSRLVESQNLLSEEHFKYGFAMGILLMKEVYELPDFQEKE